MKKILLILFIHLTVLPAFALNCGVIYAIFEAPKVYQLEDYKSYKTLSEKINFDVTTIINAELLKVRFALAGLKTDSSPVKTALEDTIVFLKNEKSISSDALILLLSRVYELDFELKNRVLHLEKENSTLILYSKSRLWSILFKRKLSADIIETKVEKFLDLEKMNEIKRESILVLMRENKDDLLSPWAFRWRTWFN